MNISGGGVCFESDEKIPKGTMLALELKSADFPSSIIALAKVMWCKKIRKKENYDVGTEFWWVGWQNGDAQQAVAKYISKKKS